MQVAEARSFSYWLQLALLYFLELTKPKKLSHLVALNIRRVLRKKDPVAEIEILIDEFCQITNCNHLKSVLSLKPFRL